MKCFKKSYYEDEKNGITRILIVGIIVVVIIWGSTFIWNYFILYDHEEFNGGTLGDSFGMVNALFTSLAFALLIYTSLMQKEELKLQRKELEENRAELKRSADAHRELVLISTEQLDLSKALYKDQLIPQLKFVGSTRTGNKQYRISLVASNCAITITKIVTKRFQVTDLEEITNPLEEGRSVEIYLNGEIKSNSKYTVKILYRAFITNYSQQLTVTQKDGKISAPAELGNALQQI